MTGLLALISFIIAAVCFVLNAAELGHIETSWGLFFTALGLALLAIGGGIAYVEAKRSA
jgi:hypothetical protein